MRSKLLKSLCIILFFNCLSIYSQVKTAETDNPCFQENEEKLSILKIAEENKYNIRQIYIRGNTFTRHRTFRQNMTDDFSEGSIFTQKNLFGSITGINKLKSINPIDLEDIQVTIEKDKSRNLDVIDFVFCVKQKEKK